MSRETCTYKQFLAGKWDIQSYYEQFVTENTINFIKDNIGLYRLRASDSPNYTDVLSPRTCMWLGTYLPKNNLMVAQLGQPDNYAFNHQVLVAGCKAVMSKYEHETEELEYE